MPFEMALPWDFYLGLTPRFSIMRDVLPTEGENGLRFELPSGYHWEFGNSIALSREFSGQKRHVAIEAVAHPISITLDDPEHALDGNRRPVRGEHPEPARTAIKLVAQS